MGVGVESPRAMRAVAARTLRFFGARPNALAALALGLVVLIYLWPALIGGQILSPTSSLYLYVPWQNLSRDVSGYFNPLLIDVPLVDYPWRFFVRELLREGTFPAWNPHVLAGTPFFSNPQTGLFSAFDVPEWVLPFNWSLGFSAALKLWTAGFGTYLLARQLRLGVLPGLLAGLSFAFCSLNIVWLTHETLPAVAALLPWMVLFVERIFERGRPGDALWLALATAIGLGGGHPGMQIHLMVVVASYLALRAALTGGEDLRARLRPLALAGGGLALGGLLMAIMLIPEGLSTRGTVGTSARTQGELPGAHMPFRFIRTVLFPDWWGRPSAQLVDQRGRSLPNYNESTFYAGVVPFLFACIALLVRDGWRRKAPFVVLGALGLAVALHVPGPYQLATSLPLLKLVQSQRLHFAFAFAVAILSAFGLRAVLDRPRTRAWLAVPAAALALGVAAIAAIGPSGKDVSRLLRHFASGTEFRGAGVIALTSVAWFLLFVVGVGAALLIARRLPQHRVAAGVAIVLLAAVDALHFAAGYQPMGPPSQAIPPRTPAIAYLQRHADDGRYFGLDYSAGVDWSLTYGLYDVRGYDPPQPTQRYFDLWRSVNPQLISWQPPTVSDISPQSLNLLSVLGVRYVLARPGLVAPNGDTPLTGKLKLAYSGTDATIFRNVGAVPRAYVARSVELTDSVERTRERVIDPGFDPRRAVLVERTEPGVAGLAGRSGGGSVAVVRDENSRVTLRATLPRRGLVVLDDQYTDGWSVDVDGHAATPLHVNDVLRGVVVPAGRHEVTWSYRVPGLRVGAALSLLALALLVAGAVGCRVRARMNHSAVHRRW